jgi:hypothetical protein
MVRWVGVILGAYLIQTVIFMAPNNTATTATPGDFQTELLGIVFGLILVAALLPREETLNEAPSRQFKPGPKTTWTAGIGVITIGSLRPSFAFATCVAPGCCFGGLDVAAVHSVVAFVVMAASLFLLRRTKSQLSSESPDAPSRPPKIGVERPILEVTPGSVPTDKESVSNVRLMHL